MKDNVKKCTKLGLYSGATVVSLTTSIKGLVDKKSTKSDKVLAVGNAAIGAYFGYKTAKSAIDLSKSLKSSKPVLEEENKIVDLDQDKKSKKD